MATLPVLIVDGEGRVVESNESAQVMLGASPGRRCADVVVAKRGTGAPLCHAGCAIHIVAARAQRDVSATWIRGAPFRLICSGLGDLGVVTILPGAHSVPVNEQLTPREKEVLGLVAAGLTSQRIARRLGVGHSTVRTHVERCRDKLGASSRAEAVAKALQQGQLTVPEARKGDSAQGAGEGAQRDLVRIGSCAPPGAGRQLQVATGRTPSTGGGSRR